MDKVRIDKVFNRLRARLYNMVEQMDLDEKQLKSYKQTIKDITSAAWNDTAQIADDFIEVSFIKRLV